MACIAACVSSLSLRSTPPLLPRKAFRPAQFLRVKRRVGNVGRGALQPNVERGVRRWVPRQDPRSGSAG
eukprot:4671610-Prymnesium_polylepis.1